MNRIGMLAYLGVIAVFLSVIHWGNRAITTAVEEQPIRNRTCIVLDAGHGGVDGGATSCTGKLESSFNLEISLRLRDLFHLLGYDTKMIRTTDTSVYTKGETIAEKKVSDLKERVRIVNETEKGILVSIHQNTFSDGKYSGAQVFYGREGESKRLADQMQEALVTTLNSSSNRKAKRADGIYLMENIKCTGVLIECGFLSNPEEEGKLRTQDYQKQLCCAIATEVIKFICNQI